LQKQRNIPNFAARNFGGDIMKALQEFEIPFLGLKEGIHDYAFDIDAEFFESFEYSEVKQGGVHVEVSMERQERMLIFNFSINGSLELPCDRCLAPITLEVKGDERLIVKFGQEWEEESDEVIIMPETESRIDISSFIYEYIMLMLPYKRVHSEDPDKNMCDVSMVEKLNQHSDTGSDPRWDALKELKNKLD
jgi:uncharacterized metal-binding protein YceD (DUF177 family)